VISNSLTFVFTLDLYYCYSNFHNLHCDSALMIINIGMELVTVYDIVVCHNCCADGCRPDVISLRAILDEVAQCNRDSFTLHRHLCATDVRLDWPLYTDEDRLALTRFGKLCELLSSVDLGRAL
jgi:RNA polymerase II elongation factor ELL